MLTERVRLTREVGSVLVESFSGSVGRLISLASGSAQRLVSLVTQHFPGFRDHCVFSGRQVFLYKRAQILVGDLWGAFGGKGMGKFDDIHTLTTFADYRVPQLLRHMGVIHYDDTLSSKISQLQPLLPGSPEEIEIRAATVQAVERMAEIAHMVPIQLDWYLWRRGEELAKTSQCQPHHRCRTVYY